MAERIISIYIVACGHVEVRESAFTRLGVIYDMCETLGVRCFNPSYMYRDLAMSPLSHRDWQVFVAAAVTKNGRVLRGTKRSLQQWIAIADYLGMSDLEQALAADLGKERMQSYYCWTAVANAGAEVLSLLIPMAFGSLFLVICYLDATMQLQAYACCNKHPADCAHDPAAQGTLSDPTVERLRVGLNCCARHSADSGSRQWTLRNMTFGATDVIISACDRVVYTVVRWFQVGIASVWPGWMPNVDTDL